MNLSAEYLRKDIERFSSESEQDRVIRDHKEAEACVQFEYHLSKGLLLYEAINRLDEWVRHRIAEGQTEYTEEIDGLICDLYRWWVSPSDRILDDLKTFQKLGYEVEHAEEFSAAVREVKGALTPDDQFFTSEKMVELRDKAIQDLQGEKCELVEA